jgi:8-oxo-dGTP pyrophosphatase MutT (NUDIX family)
VKEVREVNEVIEANEGLRERLRANLAAFQSIPLVGEGPHRAAVAVAIVTGRDGGPCFVLTERAAGMRNHPNQYALPGGRIDPGETPETAALRELDEEVGLRPGPESDLGRLDDYETRSGFVITPVVIWCIGVGAGEPAANPAEVASVRAIPLAVLDGPDVPRLQRIPESDRPVIQIPLGDDDGVYAPAGAILYQLREVGLHGRATRVAHFEQPVFAWR